MHSGHMPLNHHHTGKTALFLLLSPAVVSTHSGGSRMRGLWISSCQGSEVSRAQQPLTAWDRCACTHVSAGRDKHHSFPEVSYLLAPQGQLREGCDLGQVPSLRATRDPPGVLLGARLLPELRGRCISSPADVQYRDLMCKGTKEQGHCGATAALREMKHR